MVSRVDDRGCLEGIPSILRTGARWNNQLMPGEALVARPQPYYFTAQQLHVHTHQVVIRNVGKKAATNVRVSHHFLPDF